MSFLLSIRTVQMHWSRDGRFVELLVTYGPELATRRLVISY